MKPRRTATVLILLCVTALAVADEYRQFPGAPIDSRTLRIKEKVEDIYASGNYERALLIYAKDLAPLGDKYSQYMVGYMHLTGRGVDENRAVALAWYRLAAERGEPKFMLARDELYGSLNPAELEESRARFTELWQRLGDRKLILDLIREDLDILQERGAGTSGVRLVPGSSENQTFDPYYRRVRAQLAERLRYLNSMGDDGALGTIAADSDLAALATSIRRDLRRLDSQ